MTITRILLPNLCQSHFPSMTDVIRYYTELARLNKRERAMDADMFLQGQKDCLDGKPHKSGKGESYDRGYAAQYEMEQVQEAMSRG